MSKARTVIALVSFVAAGLFVNGALAQVPGERFVVNGVIVFEGGGVAWLQEPSLTGNRTVAVRLNDSVGTYRVTRILDDRVELQGPAGTVLVPVYGGQGSGGPVAGAAPQPVPTAGTSPRPGAMAGAEPIRSQVDATALNALRSRLDAARRGGVQPQAAPHGAVAGGIAAPTAASGTEASGTEATAANPPATIDHGPRDDGSAQVGSNNPVPNAPPPVASPEVVYPEKGQTFQSILGLK